MEFFNQTYIALRGPTGAPQTPSETIGKLADRLSPATLLADRRAAVLALKGLARAHRAEVGTRALPGLLSVLAHDAPLDADIGRAALETLGVLCDPADDAPLAQANADQLLAAQGAPEALWALLADQAFYVRFATLQLLEALLQIRRQVVQGLFLKAPEGSRGVVACLEDTREIIRNEAMILVQSLASQSAEIQKVLAFEGAFEKLFNIITTEHGVDGGIVVRDAFLCVDHLLRFNSSNQSYFRETPYPPLLCSLLLFPPNLPLHESAPQTFALQFWDEQKKENATLVVGLIGMLVNSKGGSPQETSAFTRCLLELALGSNAPTSVKSKALSFVPAHTDLPLSALTIATYVPVPETNGEEWDRLEPASALDTVVELVLHGEYAGQAAGSRAKESLELRAAALSTFEHFARPSDIKLAILHAMAPPPDGSTMAPTPLLAALAAPLPEGSPTPAAVSSTQLAALLFAHLLRGTPDAKNLARSLAPPPVAAAPTEGALFVPADAPGGAPQAPPTPVNADEEDEPQTLLQTLSEHLSLAFLARRRADASDADAREWDRLVAGYLCLLAQWLWEDPASVREFLEAGALGMLVEPINQTGEQDVLVPGLCAFVLGVCYEFNREPGEVTRATIHPILSRLGIDSLVGRMTRVREDERFRAVSPESIVLPYSQPGAGHAPAPGGAQAGAAQAEIWFDWAFVDFWKSNHHVIQRGIAADPDQLSSSGGQNAESAMLIASLREVITTQAQEIEALRHQLHQASSGAPRDARTAPASVPASNNDEIDALQKQLAAMQVRVREAEEKSRETEKEQEDLLVLLDDLNSKRRRDKQRMKDTGLEVSEDEDGDDEDDDEDDEE